MIPLFDRLKRNTKVVMMPGMDTECWLWKGRVNRDGHAKIQEAGRGSRTLYIHRAGMMLAKGAEVEEGIDVHHVCGVRNCWRPEHMEEVPHDRHGAGKGYSAPRPRLAVTLEAGDATP